MQAALVIFRSDQERRSFALTKEATVVGRREDCDLRIPLHDVSRRHCKFVMKEDGLWVEDLGSSNGTYHNGRRVQEAALAPGDTVRIGPVTFTVQIDGQPPEDQIHPPAAAAASSPSEQQREIPADDGRFGPLEALADAAGGQEHQSDDDIDLGEAGKEPSA